MSKKSKNQDGKMNKLREVLEKVYGDGIVKGAKSTAETNYKNSAEAEQEIFKLIPKEKLRNEKGKDLNERSKDYIDFGFNEAIKQIKKNMGG